MPLDIQFLLESLTNVPITNSEEYDKTVKESPDKVYNAGEPDPSSNDLLWYHGENIAFLAFKDFSILCPKNTHSTIIDIIIDTRRAGKYSKKYFSENGCFVSNEKAFIKDLFEKNGILYKYFKEDLEPNIRYDIKGVVTGRLWVNRKIISFWNDRPDVLLQWNFIEKMFKDFYEKIGLLSDYEVDWVDREPDDPLVSAKQISSSHNTSTNVGVSKKQTDFLVNLFKEPEITNKLPEDQLKKIRDQIHVMNPQMKAELLKAAGGDLYDKASEIADKLNMTVAEFNSIWNVDENKINEDPDRFGDDASFHGIGVRLKIRGIPVSAGQLKYAFYDSADAVSFVLDTINHVIFYSVGKRGFKVTHSDMGAQIIAFEALPQQFDIINHAKYGTGFDLGKNEERGPDENFEPIFFIPAKNESQLRVYVHKLSYELPLDGDISRDSRQFLTGRLWINRHAISFWAGKSASTKHFGLINKFISVFGIDKTKMIYEFIDNPHLYTYDELSKISNFIRTKKEILKLMTKQHLDPDAKRKLLVLQKWIQKVSPGFDFQAQRDAMMPALQEIIRKFNIFV